MKILIGSDYFQTEIGYAKPQIAKALKKHHHDITVLTSDRYFPFHNYESSVYKTLGNRIKRKGIFSFEDIPIIRKKTVVEFFSRAFFTITEGEINAIQPDVVISFGIASPTTVQFALLKLRCNFSLVIVDSHLPSEYKHGNQIFKSLFYFLFRTFFSKLVSKNADKCIALQDDTVQVIRNYYGIDKPIAIVPNGTDTDLFHFSRQKRNKIRKDLKIPRSATVCIYTGKVIPQKGVHLLIEAIGLLETKEKPHVIIVGSGPIEYRKLLEKRILELQLSQKIHLIGIKDHSQLFEYYSASDIAVWPLQESLAMNDAAACSLPFIASDTLGDKTRISENNAILYKEGDIKNLAKCIELLLNSPSKRKRMGERGRILTKKKLSWDSLCLQYLP